MTSFFKKLSTYKLILFIACACVVLIPSTIAANPPETSYEYEQHEIEFAILFRLLNFIEWPEEQETLKFGVLSSKEVFESAENMIQALPNSGNFLLFHIDETCSKDTLNQLSLLYVANQTHLDINKLSKDLGDFPILLVGSQSGFLENGGIVNFVDNNGRTAFEINLKRSNQVGISFRAKLLRLALRIIK